MVVTVFLVARAVPVFGGLLGLFLCLLGCAVVAARWGFDMRWVLAGSVGGLILLGAVLVLGLWLAGRRQGRR